MKNTIAIADETIAGDWLREDDPGYTGRAPDRPLLGWMIGGSVSLLLWTALSLSVWAMLMR